MTSFDDALNAVRDVYLCERQARAHQGLPELSEVSMTLGERVAGLNRAVAFLESTRDVDQFALVAYHAVAGLRAAMVAQGMDPSAMSLEERIRRAA